MMLGAMRVRGGLWATHAARYALVQPGSSSFAAVRATSSNVSRSFSYLQKKDPAASAASATSSSSGASSAAARPASPYGKRPAAFAAGSGAAAASAEDLTFDLIIIGAGSGGLALSKEASRFGQRVLVLDYVSPTPQGTKWGIGGTCVNVGCIPKKLMHQAAIVGQQVQEAHKWGWGVKDDAAAAASSAAAGKGDDESSGPAPLVVKHEWSSLVSAVQLYIKSLNFGYRSRLQKDPNIVYANMRGRMLSARTVEGRDSQGRTKVFTARKHIVIAVGGRPKYPDIPGAKELAITSDDIFSLARPPGKTLIVGAGYIALETAGFLAGLGTEVHVMARSKFLRGFDQDISEMIVQHMSGHGVTMHRGFIPTKLERVDGGSGRIRVSFSDTKDGADSKALFSDEFDTVLFAIGREPCTNDLGLESAGVEVDQSHSGNHGKILLDGEGSSSGAAHTGAPRERDPDETTAPGVFALGDVAKHRPELTPVAIGSAKLLARRLYAPPTSHSHSSSSSSASPSPYRSLDYTATPTTVFTPLEYSCVGWSEEVALKRLGGDARKIEVYHAHFRPLEWTIPERESNACYVKIVCEQVDPSTLAHIASLKSKAEQHAASLVAMRSQRVLGLHFLGPNAGEVMQGFAVAFAKGLTREDLEHAIGIHPTTAEEVLSADITKSSGEDPQKTGC